MPATNPIELYGYRPSIIANGFFLALISLCLLASLAITFVTRRCIAFSFMALCAHVFAIVSYSERIVGWSIGHYIIDNIFAAMAPLFLSIGIQICATKIIRVLGAEHSLLKPRHYARLFITLTVIAGTLQILGLAISFADATLYALGPLANGGRWIVLSGVALLSVNLITCFVLLGVVFVRAAKAQRQYGYTTFHKEQGYVPLSSRFKTFLAVLPLAAASVLARCLYRVVFFYGGLKGSVAQNQAMYIGCEGILLVEAMVALTVFHPALWLDDGKRIGEDVDSRGHSRDVEESLGEVSRLILKANAMAAPSETSSEESGSERAALTPSDESEVSSETSSHYSR